MGNLWAYVCMERKKPPINLTYMVDNFDKMGQNSLFESKHSNNINDYLKGGRK